MWSRCTQYDVISEAEEIMGAQNIPSRGSVVNKHFLERALDCMIIKYI